MRVDAVGEARSSDRGEWEMMGYVIVSSGGAVVGV